MASCNGLEDENLVAGDISENLVKKLSVLIAKRTQRKQTPDLMPAIPFSVIVSALVVAGMRLTCVHGRDADQRLHGRLGHSNHNLHCGNSRVAYWANEVGAGMATVVGDNILLIFDVCHAGGETGFRGVVGVMGSRLTAGGWRRG